MSALELYGATFGRGLKNQIDVELALFRVGGTAKTSKYYHYRKVVEHWYGPKSSAPYIWTKRATRLAQAFCSERVVYVSGNASSNKSRGMALYLLMTWVADPGRAKGVVVSVTTEGAAERAWGDVLDLYQALPTLADGSQIGRVTKQPKHTLTLAKGLHPKAGLQVIASGLPLERQAVHKLQGLKTKNKATWSDLDELIGDESGALVLGLDEGPAIASGAYRAYYDNLRSVPGSQLIVLGNFEDTLSEFGRRCEPEDGWPSVTADDEEWRNKDGDLILHFDGLQSENWIARQNGKPDVYIFEQPSEEIQKYYDKGRTNTPAFWTMVRSFPAPAGVNQGMIYNEADVRAFHAADECPVPRSTYRRFIGLDPAFGGGDEAIATVISVGVTDNHLYIVTEDQVAFEMDTSKVEHGPTYQLKDQLIALAAKWNVARADCGFDDSDNGFRSVMLKEFSKDVQLISFNGSADDEIQSELDPRPNSERFLYMVSQLWGNGVDFLRGDHLRQVPEDCLKQLCMRQWRAGTGTMRQQVETKKEFKKRTGKKSPDRADSVIVAWTVAVRRMNLRPGLKGAPAKPALDRQKLLEKLNAVAPQRTLQTVGVSGQSKRFGANRFDWSKTPGLRRPTGRRR